MISIKANAGAWIRGLLLLCICTLVLAAIWWKARGYGHEVIPTLTAWVESFGWIGWAAFMIALIVVCISGVLPASMLAVAAGSIYGLTYGFFLCAISILVAACLAFLLSRYVLRDRLETLLSSHALAANLDREIAASGWKLVFLLRMSPLAPFGLVSYAFGLSRINMLDYILGTLASLPSLLALVYTGAIAGKVIFDLGGISSGRSLFDWIILVGGFVATVIGVVYLTSISRRALTRASQLPKESG